MRARPPYSRPYRLRKRWLLPGIKFQERNSYNLGGDISVWWWTVAVVKNIFEIRRHGFKFTNKYRLKKQYERNKAIFKKMGVDI